MWLYPRGERDGSARFPWVFSELHCKLVCISLPLFYCVLFVPVIAKDCTQRSSVLQCHGGSCDTDMFHFRVFKAP